MNSKFSIVLVLLVLTGWAAAELPRKAPLTKYRNLWQNSPFTSKPPDRIDTPAEDVLKDYALAGVSPIKGGHRVTIINKKNPDERKYVYSDQPNASHGFKIVSVERKEGDMRGTVVHMMSGTQKGTVSYDEKFLTITAPQPPVPQPNDRGRGRGVPGRPGGDNAVPNNPNQAGAANPQGNQQVAPRAPRPRVIGPPPTPAVRTTNDSITNPAPAQREPRR
jgi:hypothetical protein